MLTALVVIYLHVSLSEQGQIFAMLNEKNFAHISVSINNHKLITHLSCLLLEQSKASSSTKTNSYLFCLTLDACQSNEHRAYLLNFGQLAEMF